MIISQYGIVLKRVEHSDIELIRQKRNLPAIRKQMEYKRIISPQMQEKWFESINNKWNYYFMIEWKDKPVGVINAKNVNMAQGYGEGGIFVWDTDASAEFVPVLASLCLLNTIFDTLCIFNKSFVKISSDNHRAIAFNKLLGYVLVPGQENKKFQYYLLTTEDYQQKAKKIITVSKKLTKGASEIQIIGQPEARNLDEINKVLVELNPAR